MTACTSYKNDEVLTESGLSKSRFQTEINGEKTDLFVLKNKNKMEVCITNYGGRIVSVMVPDKDGIMRDVVLGFDSIQELYQIFRSDFSNIRSSRPIYLQLHRKACSILDSRHFFLSQ